MQALTGAKPAKGSVGRDAIKTSLTELCRSTVGAGKKPTAAQENEVRRLAKVSTGHLILSVLFDAIMLRDGKVRPA